MWKGNKFPSLQINPQNVSGIWDDFWMEFTNAMEALTETIVDVNIVMKRPPRSRENSPRRDWAIVPYRREGKMPYRREGGKGREYAL